MTTELEQEFFDTFGIENRFIIQTHEKLYPEITAEKLLELICILSAYNYIFEDLKADNIEQLKEEIIKLFLDYPSIIEEEKTNIQQLFNEDDRMIYIETTMLDIITDEEEY